jgi:Pyruvate phosphate dikinase, AMP/ATP-binding domain
VLENGPANVKLTVSLRDLSRADTACAGGKAATLGELSTAGFPVPDGFVVTIAAFERFLAHNALVSGHTPAQVEAGVLPDDVAAAIRAAAVPYTANGAPLAVRSSSVAEDLAAASFAGQYATVLGVTGTSQTAATRIHFPRPELEFHELNEAGLIYINQTAPLRVSCIESAVEATKLRGMRAEHTRSRTHAKTVAVITVLCPQSARFALGAGIHRSGPPAPPNPPEHHRRRG